MCAKNKQYLIHFALSFSGIIFPLILIFGNEQLNSQAILPLILTYAAAYPLNFFLTALVYKSGSTARFNTFFFR